MSEPDFTGKKLGEFISFSGKIITARDRAHEFILNSTDEELEKIGLNLNQGIIYHCGPIMKKLNEKYYPIAAGPTTSTRMNKFTPQLIERFKLKAIIGKGGMNRKVVNLMKENGCVYLQAIGGAGALLAKSITNIEKVLMLKEFGMAEAIWVFKVKNFPAIIGIDNNRNSLYENILNKSKQKLNDFL